MFFLGARGATRRRRCPASLAKDAEARAAALVSLVTLECSNLEPTRVEDQPGGGARGKD